MNRNLASFIAAVAGLVLQSTALQATVLPNPTITAAADRFNPSFDALNVFDSRRAEYATSSNGAGTPLSNDIQNGTWINFDFGAPRTMDRFVMVARQNAVDVIVRSRLVFSSDATFDAADPNVVFDPSGSNGSGIIQSFGAQTAQYVRWEVLTRSGAGLNLGAQEMRFLNTAPMTEIIPGVTVINAATAFPGVPPATYAAVNAVNGNAGREPGFNDYASFSQGTNMFIDFDLGERRRVSGFDYFDRLSETEDVSGFNLIFSNDPSFSTVVAMRSYDHPLGDGFTTTDTFSYIKARYVRLDATFVDGAGTNTGVSEMIFYQAIPEPASSTLAIFGLVTLRLIRRRRRTK